MKKTIGIILFTKIGTKTSILSSEFEFWNTFKKFNPDIDFVFIPISEYVNKNIIKNRSMLNFPISILKIYKESDLPKLKGLSGIFSYMTRNSFFAGKVDMPSIANYNICSYCTNELKIPLFIRLPDSEYPYYDYKKMISVRTEYSSKKSNSDKFLVTNEGKLNTISDKFIDYKKTYFIANGSKIIFDWVPDVVINDVPSEYRIIDKKIVEQNSIYVSDEYLFNVSIYREKYSYLNTEATENKFLFIGYLSGSVSKNRIKLLNKMFNGDRRFPPIDIIGPGASELTIDNPSIKLIDTRIIGDKFFETLNSYLGYIFIGKGNSINKYVNKTVYDCLCAKCPIVVYSPCDKNQLLFSNREFYFETPEELMEIFEKLKSIDIRNRWISEQREELENILKTKMEPMFSFSDYCTTAKKFKSDIQLIPADLF